MRFRVNRKRWRRQHLWFRGWIALFGSLIFCLCLGNPTASQPAVTAVQQGIDRYHKGDLQGAIDCWQQSLGLDRTATPQRIEVLKYLARAEQQLGQIDQAIDHFEQAINQYRQAGNWLQIGRMQTEQAQAYSDLGHYQQALRLLCANLSDRTCARESALEIARRHSDALGQAAALGSLGDVYALQGEYDRALERLRESQTIAEQIGNVPYSMAIWNSLGNLYTSLAQRNYRYVLNLDRIIENG